MARRSWLPSARRSRPSGNLKASLRAISGAAPFADGGSGSRMKLLRMISRLSDWGLYVAMIATVAIMALVTVDVILRNAGFRSIPGAVEISEFLQGIVVFFGIAATLKSGNHIAADLLVGLLSKRSQAAVDLVTNLLSLGTFGLMTYALWTIADGPGAGYEISDVLGIPTQPFRFLAVVGVGLMCFEIVRLIVGCASALGDGRDNRGDGEG